MDQLTVLIETKPDTIELISRAHDALVAERERLLKETGLKEVSFLRGDLDFCRTTLRKPRKYPAIAILDARTYADTEPRDSVLNAGVALVFNAPSANLESVEKLVAHIHDCVMGFLCQR